MRGLQRLAGLAAGLLVLGCLLACGNVRQAALDAQMSNDLKQIGLAYHNYCDINVGTAPLGPADLAKVNPEAKLVIDETGPGGKYVFIYGVKLTDLQKQPGGTSAYVLGYAATVPATGGPVLFADASVRKMTAGEFATTPKATPGAAGNKK